MLIWRIYRNLLLGGTPLATLILVVPPLVRILLFNEATPIDDALQYLPGITIVVIYLAITAMAIFVIVLALGPLLALVSVGLWRWFGPRWGPACAAIVNWLMITGGYGLLLRFGGQLSAIDGVSVLLIAGILSGIIVKTLAGWLTAHGHPQPNLHPLG